MFSFAELLLKDGWEEIKKDVEYKRGHNKIIFDTSSWMMLSSPTNQRIFDVRVPSGDEARWTINLIEHLFRTDDEMR